MVPSISKTFALILMSACALSGAARCVAADTSLLSQLDQLVTAGDLAGAVDVARQLHQHPEWSTDRTLPLARLARALQQRGEIQAAAAVYQQALEASAQPTAESLSPPTVVLVRLAAGSAMTQAGELDHAVGALRPVLSRDSVADDTQREMAVSILLRIGAMGLAAGSTGAARDAYSIATLHADEARHATAMLGEAWAAALHNDDPLEAARKLAAFTDRYGSHADAPRAARACAECLKQAGRAEDATVMLADLLDRWPASQAAVKVVSSHCGLPIHEVPPEVRRWILATAESEDLSSVDAQVASLGLRVAADENELAAWNQFGLHLASVDQTGQATSDLLTRLVNEGHEGDAERLTTMLIAPDVDADRQGLLSSAAREAACRWAGRTQRWSMLALAADAETVTKSSPTRTVAVERLFAESLMQTGRTGDARAWWNHLVDDRGASDFATLLRCAEAETAFGRDIATAESRIAAARQAAGENEFSVSLVDMIEAELSIRRLQFDAARGLLEHVIRTSQADAGLRGRAQWLIGETHYLQQNFAHAIEAYRLVEGIDPGGIWVSAALVQAGKSFEQLGRTREAAVCYGNLLSRFADTSHADLARRRLAAIAPDDQPSKNSQPTIRR